MNLPENAQKCLAPLTVVHLGKGQPCIFKNFAHQWEVISCVVYATNFGD